ncbi:MAG: hypothetical protein R3F61_27250 [Myxococcota bacterium]
MKHVIPGLLAVLPAVFATGCLNDTELQLSVLIREPALQAVPNFPVRLLIDVGGTQNRELHLCDWSAGFLETEVEATGYDKCPEPFTVEAVLAPLLTDCEDGLLRLTQDWVEDDSVRYGYGSIDIFETGACNVLEQRQINVDPVD